MPDRLRHFAALSTVFVMLVALTGCGKVDQDVFDEEVADIRSELAQHDSTNAAQNDSIAALRGDLSDLEEDLRAELQTLRDEYGARIEQLEDGIRFAMPVHFDFDEAEIRQADHAILDRFASVAQAYYDGATITVEGFADPAGSEAYNRRLSQRRAQAVADYLVRNGGLSEESLNTVGYGETRLVRPGASGPGSEGIENRRVTFVVEHAGEVRG
jgi:peptidoglycan-associated lipoprotein